MYRYNCKWNYILYERNFKVYKKNKEVHDILRNKSGYSYLLDILKN